MDDPKTTNRYYQKLKPLNQATSLFYLHPIFTVRPNIIDDDRHMKLTFIHISNLNLNQLVCKA